MKAELKHWIKKILPAGAFAIVFMLTLCSGCGGTTPESPTPLTPPASSEGGETEETSYQAPKFRGSAFHADKAEGDGSLMIDLSAVKHGYVAVSAVSDVRLKFQVIKDDITYNYDVASNGDPSVFPIQSGNGTYTFRIMENIVDNKYAVGYSTTAEVKLKDEYQPFLRPSNYSNYNENSACVKKAAEFSANAKTASDVITQVYDFVCKTVTYDYPKAENVKSGYMPVPDETMETGKGICFDYASLAAAMLRSQGIPTKIIFGYVAPNDVYHAWNMFYTKEDGWTTVKFQVNPNDWTRMDLTFSANGSNSKFIGDGSNYSDVYEY